MTNADKFKAVFGIYSEEFWAKPESDMLNWINSEYQEPTSKVDVQPVVRCNECKLYDGVHNARGVALCLYWMHMTIWDDYCSHGMRKDGES